MRKFWLLTLLTAAVMTAFFCCAEETGGLIYNGGFEAADAEDGWYTENYYFGASEFEIVEDENGGHAAYVCCTDEDDARYVQWVDAEPDTLYDIRCRVRVDEPILNGRGANVSVLNSLNAYSESVYDTHGQWQELRFVGRTGPDQYGFYIALRVGGYSATSTGSAYFDDISVTPAEDTDGIPEVSLTTFPSVVENKTDDTAEKPNEPVRYTENICLVAALVLMIELIVISRSAGARRVRHERAMLAAVLLGAFAVRIWAAFMVRGYDVDITDFELWGERMASQLFAFYGDGSYFCDYPPLYMLLLGFVSAVKNLFGIGFDTLAHQIAVKLMPMLADLASAYLVYRITKKRFGRLIPFAAAFLVAFNPAFIIDSAAWGQIDSVFTLMIAGAVLLAADDKPAPAMILFALSALIKPQPLLFAPLGLVIIVVRVVRDRKLMREAVIGLVAALALVYAVALPFAASSARATGTTFGVFTPISWLIKLYTGTVSGYKAITVNALNVYNIFGLNWTDIDNARGLAVFGWIMFGAAYLFTCASVIFTRHKRPACLTAAALMTLIFNFAPMMHERYLFPAILLLFLAYAETGDRRVLYAAAMMTVTQSMNMALVLQGGTVREFASLGHLQSSESAVNAVVSAVNVLLALYVAWLDADILLLGQMLKDGRARVFVPVKRENTAVTSRERIAVVLLTVLYAGFALFNVGSMTAPETAWDPYDGGSAVFDLGETRSFRLTYYTGYTLSGFTVALSNDGINWSGEETALCNQGEIFRWSWFVPVDENDKTVTANSDGLDPMFAYPVRSSDDYPMQTARYVRLTAAGSETELREVAFLTEDGSVLPVTCDIAELTDEQDIVESEPSWYNSTYFDEIYHVRTAYEHLNGLNTYEWTHPPLGKVLIMFGIKLFGMTPFGWRFSGTMAGVAMLPVIYIMIRLLTGRRDLSFIGLIMLALDSMHYTQSRLATVDSYAVLFIMAMFMFMFMYMRSMSDGKKLAGRLVPLALSGVTMGLACASKWIGIYAAAGLAVLFAGFEISCAISRSEKRKAGNVSMLFGAAASAAVALYAGACLILVRGGKPVTGIFPETVDRLLTLMPKGACIALLTAASSACLALTVTLGVKARGTFEYETAVTGIVCVLSFVIAPLAIYYYSYTWQLACEGGVSLKRVIELQQSMFNYHAGLGSDTHYFRSPWYEWPLIVRPMWYYSASSAYLAPDMVSSISCMGNPAVWWTGCAATIYSLISLCVTRRVERERLAAVIGFLTQFLPWVLVPRSTFIYHYFASVPFIIILTVMALNDLRHLDRTAYQMAAAVILGLALVMFAMFYPLESGVTAEYGYMLHLRWFKWYNFALK